MTPTKPAFNLWRLILEGRAFFALIAIIIVFSLAVAELFHHRQLSDHVQPCGDLRHPCHRDAAGDPQRRD